MQPNNISSFFGTKVSKPGIPVNQASDKQLVYKDDFSTKTYFDQTNSRMLEGLLPDGSYGLWVSKPGYDVTTATSDQLIFNSNQNIFRIVDTINVSLDFVLSGAGHTTTVNTPHGLDYTPGYLAYITNDPTFASFFGALSNNGPNPNLIYSIGATSISVIAVSSVSVDSTNISFQVSSSATGAGTYTFTARVYLLQETAVI